MSLIPMRTTHLHLLLLLIFDALAGILVFNALFWLRGVTGAGNWMLWSLSMPLGIIMVSLYLIDGYRSRTEMMSADYLSQHVLAVFVALLVTLLVTFVALPSGFPLQGSRSVIAFAFLTLAFVTLSYRRSIHRWRVSRRQVRTILFIGDIRACADFRALCSINRLQEKVVCAVIGADAPAAPLGPADEDSHRYDVVVDEIRSGGLNAEAIVIKESAHSLPDRLAEELTELYFNGTPTFTLELFYETYLRKIPLYRINHIWLFQKGFEIARNPVFARTKRMCDLLFSLIGMLLAAPLLILAAIAIKLEDGGPVFFRQSRVGLNRRQFAILKLRTMRVAPTSRPAADNRYTQKDDPRITRIGGLLRKTRIDEVPQLWNVLKGDMSLIGPRAEWTELVKDYEEHIPCYHFRHLVKPGITGWAQINYPYGANIDDTLRKLEYDLYYIRHFSFVMDAAIIQRTIHLMLFGKGH